MRQPRLAVAIGRYRAAESLQLGVVKAAITQLDLHGEATGVADALDRWRNQYESHRIGQLVEFVLQVPIQRRQVGTGSLATQAPVLQDDIGNAGVRQSCTVVQYGNPA